GGEDHDGALGHLLGLVHEDRAAFLQGLDDVHVVNDLLAHVNGGPVLVQGDFDRLHGAVHTRAVTAWFGEQNLALAGGGHTPYRTGRSSRPRTAAVAPPPPPSRRGKLW